MSEELQQVVEQSENQEVSSQESTALNPAWEDMLQKYQSQEVFTVVVQDVVKGGVVADVGVRAFIPASLLDTKYVEDLSVFKGQSIEVRVAEIDPSKNRLVLSRKAVLEEKQREEAKRILSELQVGEVYEGTVRRLADFGAFVEVRGVDGLVHVSELSWQHVNHPSEAVQPGDKVQVKVLQVQPETGRLSLSIKAATKGPWDSVADEIHEGDTLTGVVRRLTDFGAFVELRPGVEGLLHVSQISNQRVKRPSDVLQEGQEVKVKVLSVDVDKKRVSLSMRDEQTPTAKELRQETEKYVNKQKESGTGVTLGELFGDLFKKM
jgi:small subunit ribosomal protein S1